MRGVCASCAQTMKPGALLVQIKETFIQLIAGTDLLVTGIRLRIFMGNMREALRNVIPLSGCSSTCYMNFGLSCLNKSFVTAAWHAVHYF